MFSVNTSDTQQYATGMVNPALNVSTNENYPSLTTNYRYPTQPANTQTVPPPQFAEGPPSYESCVTKPTVPS